MKLRARTAVGRDVATLILTAATSACWSVGSRDGGTANRTANSAATHAVAVPPSASVASSLAPPPTVPSPPLSPSQLATRDSLAALAAKAGDCSRFKTLTLSGRPPAPTEEPQPVPVLRPIGSKEGCYVPVSGASGQRWSDDWTPWLVRPGQAPIPLDSVPRSVTPEATVEALLLDTIQGHEALVVVEHHEHPEGVGEHVEIYAYLSTGAQRPLIPMRANWRAEDTDGDGRVDGFSWDTTRLHNRAGCGAEVWEAETLAGPTLRTRRLPDGTYTFLLAGAQATTLPVSVAADRAGRVDERATLARLVDSLQRGAPRKEWLAALERGCPRAREIPADCRRLRPGSCAFRDHLLSVANDFPEGAFAPWVEQVD